MGTFFGKLLIFPHVEIREFHDLMRMDKSHWPSCLLRLGWLPLLFGVNCASADEGAGNLLECSTGSHSSRLLFEWNAPDEFDKDDAVRRVPENPTCGLMVVLCWMLYLVPLLLDLVCMRIKSGST